jgi:hypothetical protein
MASYTRRYGGNYTMVLAGYNAGLDTIQYAVNTCGSNWFNCLPYETRYYISVIMGDTPSHDTGQGWSVDVTEKENGE